MLSKSFLNSYSERLVAAIGRRGVPTQLPPTSALDWRQIGRFSVRSCLGPVGQRKGRYLSVTTLKDSGPGSLRGAIVCAAAGDRIN